MQWHRVGSETIKVSKQFVLSFLVLVIALIINLSIVGVKLQKNFGYGRDDVAARVFMLLTVLLGVFPPVLIFKSLNFNVQVTTSIGKKSVFKPQALEHLGHPKDILIDTSSLRGKNEMYSGFQVIDRKVDWDSVNKVNKFTNVFKHIDQKTDQEIQQLNFIEALSFCHRQG